MAYLIIGIILFFCAILFTVYSYYRFASVQKELISHEKEMNRRMYEIAILKQLGERIGYSLNIQEIVDIIAGSLHQFVEYSSVSYMILQPEDILFNVHLEQSVARGFIDDVKKRMLNSLSALLDQDFGKQDIKEVISGAILIEDIETPVQSFFNIPLVIGEKVVGVLTIAHTQSGLYKDEEMTILYKITQQASQAVTKLQEVVKTEEQKLNAMVESMTEGVIMTDKDLVIQVVNPVIRKALGLEASDDVRIFDVMNALEGKIDIRSMLEESIKLDKVVTRPEIVVKDQVFQVYVAPVKVTISAGQEEVIGAVILFHDITHDKELEQLREEFTSMMVHELRSPLDNIKRISEELEKGQMVKDESEKKEFLQLIYHNSSDMLELVNDLLDVAKIESGKFEITKENVDIRTVINNRVEFYNSLANSDGIKINIKVAENVPNKVFFDPHRMGQVIDNYLSNAIKYSPSNSVISINAFIFESEMDLRKMIKQEQLPALIDPKADIFSKLPKSLMVTVSDQGKGIEPKKVPALFNKFTQFETRVEIKGKKGTGLGLAIVKGIVESHGGNVGVFTRVDQGSSFYFTLPLVEI